MNCQKLYALVRAFEGIGYSHQAAFAKAFAEYQKMKEQKSDEQSMLVLVSAACCEGSEA